VKGEEEEVEVSTGKVSFAAAQGKDSKVILLPGDKAVLKADGTIDRSKAEDPNSLSWKNAQLRFNNLPLSEVTRTMQDYFNVPVVIENTEIKNCLFTGEFEKPDIDMMLKVLSVSLNLSYKKEGEAYVLTGSGCN
jgi:ferric-dicitrate binding protein FerR (iron transport regulator)